jgi:hypothetical protein
VALSFDAHQPGFRPLLGGDRVADAVDIETAMGTRPNAGIFLSAPVNEVVLAPAPGRAWLEIS